MRYALEVMTLCVATKCLNFNDDMNPSDYDLQIATCCDHELGEEGLGTSETTFKREFLTEKWAVLFAGPIPQCRELMALYQEMLDKKQDTIDQYNMLDVLREPLHKFRRKLANSLTHARIAMSYDELLERHGRSEISPEIYNKISDEISSQRIEPELILIGSVGGWLEMFECSSDVTLCENFAAIGSGKWIARAALYQREYSMACDRAEALYSCYEAKRLGQKAEGVGEKSLISLFCVANGRLHDCADSFKLEPFMKRQFKRFGPRQITLNRFQLPDDAFRWPSPSKDTNSSTSQI
jgi:hypothetical protein